MKNILFAATVAAGLAMAIPALAIPVASVPSLPVNENDIASFSVELNGVAQGAYTTNGSTVIGNAKFTTFSTKQLLPLIGLAFSNNASAFNGCSLRLRLSYKGYDDYQTWSVQVLRNGNVVLDTDTADPYSPTNADSVYANFYVGSDHGPLIGTMNSNIGGTMTQIRSGWFGFYYEYYVSGYGWQEPFDIWGDGTIEEKVVSNGTKNSYSFSLTTLSGEYTTETNNITTVQSVTIGGSVMGKGSNTN